VKLDIKFARRIRPWLWLALSCALVTMTASARDPDPNNPPANPAQTKIQVEALAMLFQVVDQLSGFVTNKDLAAIHNEDLTLAAAVNELLSRADAFDPARAILFKTNVTEFTQRVGDLHLAGDLKNQARAERTLPTVLEAFDKVKTCFPASVTTSARQRADAFMCPVHRDVVGRRSDYCPKCGAPLDQSVRILSFGSGTPAPPAVRATVRTTSPLTVGQPVKAFLLLEKSTGEPISPPDLIESHTRKIHLLIADESMTDYHHEHPQPTKVPGEYTFTFTPRKPGTYRVWADIRPYPLGLQQYAVTDIPAATLGEPLAKSSINLKTNIAGRDYELILPTNGIEAARSATARLRITEHDGRSVTNLEPLMAAFAHIVGFHEDRMTILHMHPSGAPVLDSNVRGGPELEFQIFSLKSGYVRLFAQVQIAGESHFAAFTIGIKPAGSIPPPQKQERKLTPFNLVERSGRRMTQDDFAGKIVAVNLMFTGCSLSSGEVMNRMADLQRRTARMPDVLLVSLTVDPLSDTPAVLTEFANTYGADTNRWLFLTGAKTEIRRLIQTSFFPPSAQAEQMVPGGFTGIDTISLVDPNGNVLDSFEGLNPNVVDAVMPEITKLSKILSSR